jgi:hypothetical protein
VSREKATPVALADIDLPGDHLRMTQEITFVEMRSAGVCGVIVWCRDHPCSHSVRLVLIVGPTMSGSPTSRRLQLHCVRQARCGRAARFRLELGVVLPNGLP